MLRFCVRRSGSCGSWRCHRQRTRLATGGGAVFVCAPPSSQSEGNAEVINSPLAGAAYGRASGTRIAVVRLTNLACRRRTWCRIITNTSFRVDSWYEGSHERSELAPSLSGGGCVGGEPQASYCMGLEHETP